MRSTALSIGLLSVALFAAPVTSASAHGFHHHYGLIGGIFGLAGDVVVGAATIVTAPVVILADAVSGPRHEREDRYGYDRSASGYDGGGPDEYADARGDYREGPGDRYGPREEYGERDRTYASPPDEDGDEGPPPRYRDERYDDRDGDDRDGDE